MCCSKGLLKRFVPFFAAFGLGLLIASFFVTVAAPSFRIGRGGMRHRDYDRQMQSENIRLREENIRLRQSVENNVQQNADFSVSADDLVPPPPPLPPVAPRRIR